MSVPQAFDIVYGFSQALTSVFPAPILSQRDPTTSDKKKIGQIWINVSTSNAFIETSIINNSATWQEFGGGGDFTSLTVNGLSLLTGTTEINTTGGATTTIGTGGTGAVDIGNTTGNTAVTGSMTVSGNITSTTGEIEAMAGNIVASTGNLVGLQLQLAGGITVQTGAGVPSSALALAIGDMYINTTAASPTTRLYIATAVGTFTNVTCAA